MHSHIPVLCIGAVVMQRPNAFFFKTLQYTVLLVVVALFYILLFLLSILPFNVFLRDF